MPGHGMASQFSASKSVFKSARFSRKPSPRLNQNFNCRKHRAFAFRRFWEKCVLLNKQAGMYGCLVKDCILGPSLKPESQTPGKCGTPLILLRSMGSAVWVEHSLRTGKRNYAGRDPQTPRHTLRTLHEHRTKPHHPRAQHA